MNHSENFRSWVKKRMAIESYYYLDHGEKFKLENQKRDDKHQSSQKVCVNLMNLRTKESFLFVASGIVASLVFDSVYKRERSYSNLAKNITMRLLVLNSVYYLLFSDFTKFYEISYLK